MADSSMLSGAKGPGVTFSWFRSWQRAYELRASERDILMMTRKFSALAKTQTKYCQVSRM